MPKTTATGVDPALYGYLVEHSVREPSILAKLRAETGSHPMSIMQITPDEGQFLRLLVELTGARTIVEVGSFTGYSSLAMALSLPDGGKLYALDVDAEAAAVARRYWEEAGVAEKIELRLGPGVETLDQLLSEPGAGSIDLAFIDADKPSYPVYYERCLNLLRPGGLICVDNVFMMGGVLEETGRDENAKAMKAFNAALAADGRVTLSMLPVGDGLTLARKR